MLVQNSVELHNNIILWNIELYVLSVGAYKIDVALNIL